MINFKDRRLVAFGIQVRLYRERLGLTVEEVAARGYLSVRDLQAIEEGNKNFGFTTFLELCNSLGVKPSDILNFDFEGPES
ncbi:helix-turn-helix transcriptional regulator [uncultured Flavobacterium sp.]|uniref:helix-turn-helix domain-containing protein n=1 Tax=uncultured Flavobacterium sp. TaxID=165435 RepID=UPI003451163B